MNGKRMFHAIVMAAAAVVMVAGFTACSGGSDFDSTNSGKSLEATKQPTLIYVNPATGKITKYIGYDWTDKSQDRRYGLLFEQDPTPNDHEIRYTERDHVSLGHRAVGEHVFESPVLVAGSTHTLTSTLDWAVRMQDAASQIKLFNDQFAKPGKSEQALAGHRIDTVINDYVGTSIDEAVAQKVIPLPQFKLLHLTTKTDPKVERELQAHKSPKEAYVTLTHSAANNDAAYEYKYWCSEAHMDNTNQDAIIAAVKSTPYAKYIDYTLVFQGMDFEIKTTQPCDVDEVSQ